MRSRRIFFPRLACLALTVLSLLLVQITIAHAADSQIGGFVYVMTNQDSGNSVVVYKRSTNGTLHRAQEVSTHGLGSGGTQDPLASQGALKLSSDGKLLFAVNAGSNEISVLGTSGNGLKFLSKANSGGDFPVSVAVHNDFVYVLNAHGTPNVSGFVLDPQGILHAIPNSILPLAGGSGSAPAQVGFSQDGDMLVVTETATNLIDVFLVSNDGHAASPVSQPSSGITPFGFSFGHLGRLFVSEAAAGVDGASTASSYQFNDSNMLQPISTAVPDTQTAACWMVLTNTGRFAFTSNSGSGTISSYSVPPNGKLTLAEAVAGRTGDDTLPIDMAMSRDSEFLYVVNSAIGGVSIFEVNGGKLSSRGNFTGLPLSIQGIAAQ